MTLTLADEIDVSRGDVLAAAEAPPAVANQFEATIVWMHDEPLLQGRAYLLKLGTKTVTATVAPIKYRVNVNTLEHLAAKKLDLNDIGVCGLEVSSAIAFESYRDSRVLGGFILIDRLTNNTVGAGLLHFALRRSQNVHWQALDVNKARARAIEPPEALHTLVHRPVGRRQIDHRQLGREAAARRRAGRLTCWTATMCATDSTRTWASRIRIGWRISAASPRWRA